MDKYPIPLAMKVREVRLDKQIGFAFLQSGSKRIHFAFENQGIFERIKGNNVISGSPKEKQKPKVGDIIFAKIHSGRNGLYVKKWVFLEQVKDFYKNRH